jgi:hypothetical protein
MPNPGGPKGDPWEIYTASDDTLIYGIDALPHGTPGFVVATPSGRICGSGPVVEGVEAAPPVNCDTE